MHHDQMMRKSTHTKEYSIFLQLLMETRQKMGLTQVQLGQELPFEQPALSKIERGERRVDIIELKMICDRLGVSIGDFVRELERRMARANA
jgi:transcriptional regulator with XRE-family HTH domain